MERGNKMSNCDFCGKYITYTGKAVFVTKIAEVPFRACRKCSKIYKSKR